LLIQSSVCGDNNAINIESSLITAGAETSYILHIIAKRYLYMQIARNSTPPSILHPIKDCRRQDTEFNSIVVSNGEGTIPIRELNPTTKQYYSRISGLLDAGLIKRYKGKHSLTLLGKVVYNSQIIIGKALTY
jgi:hypothetical protein